MTTASITTRTRMMVQDTGRPFANNVLIDGLSNVFNLSVESISQTADPPIVALGGVIISGQTTEPYYIDYKYGQIVFYVAPQPAGTQLSVTGITYDYFDDDEVLQAVQDSFNLHVADQSPLPVIDPVAGSPSLSTQEEYLVSILAAIELLWFRATDAAQEIDIDTPEGVHMARSERYRQIMQQIDALKAEYNQIAGALGVGLYRIQILFQRRVSATTNRLTPLFQEQEYNQPYTGFEPTTGAPGALISIFGEYFTGATAVNFGTYPAVFNVVSDTEIIATVPNAPLGTACQIGIVTPEGSVLTTAQFVVGQPAPFVLYGPEQVKPPIPPGI